MSLTAGVSFVLPIIVTVTATKNTLVLKPQLSNKVYQTGDSELVCRICYWYTCEIWNVHHVSVFHSYGMIITSSGIHLSIQVWPMWDFLTISFGSQTFCCITGKYYKDRSAWCCTVIGYAWCQTQHACIVLYTIEWGMISEGWCILDFCVPELKTTLLKWV